MLKDINVLGGDTETCDGKPFSLQFTCQSLGIREIIWCDESTAERKFLKFCDSLPNGESVIGIHNLSYDLISLFYKRHVIFASEEFAFEAHGWSVSGVYANVVFAKLRKGSKTVHLIDTGAYFKTALRKLAALFCPELPKLASPTGLGERVFGPDDTLFVQYAMRDSEIAEIVMKRILEMHSKYDIPLSVSAPHFASRVFKTRYMQADIPMPAKKSYVYAALHSYHGGKNNITVPFGWYQRVQLYDIVSAYPAAMRELPSFYNADKFREISGGELTSPVPRYGIYRISGSAKACKWPALYDHSFTPLNGDFEHVWVTGPELNQALSAREVVVRDCYGIFYDASEADFHESPFKAYVDEFYELKNKATLEGDTVTREFAKLLLNSLYGKFVQTDSGSKAALGYYFDLDKQKIGQEKILVAGGLFNPFIATLITGIVRAQIHAIEHKTAALHTATDGVFSLNRNIHLSEKLGGLKLEVFGDLLLFRNKLYILYGQKGKLQSKVFKGRAILKYALHGFNGSVFDLEKIYVSGNPTYEFKKVNKLRESLRHNLAVNAFEIRQGSLNIEGLNHGEETDD